MSNVVVDAVGVHLVPAALRAQQHAGGVAPHADRLDAHHHVRAPPQVARAALLGVRLQRNAGNVANGLWERLLNGLEHLILLRLALLRGLQPIRHHRLVQRDVSLAEVGNVGGALLNVGKRTHAHRPVRLVTRLAGAVVPAHLDVQAVRARVERVALHGLGQHREPRGPALLAQLRSVPAHATVRLRNALQGLPRARLVRERVRRLLLNRQLLVKLRITAHDGADVPVAVRVVLANSDFLRPALVTPKGSELERVREVVDPPALCIVAGDVVGGEVVGGGLLENFAHGAQEVQNRVQDVVERLLAPDTVEITRGELAPLVHKVCTRALVL